MLQLDPALQMSVWVGDRWQKAWCHVLLDYGIEGDLYWACISDESGEIWVMNNRFVRGQTNISIGRRVNLPTDPTAYASKPDRTEP